MNKTKLYKYLSISNFILWTGMLISVIFLDLNANALKEIAVLSTFIVVADLVVDMLENRDNRIKKEAFEKKIIEFIEKEKQGDK